MSDDNNIRHGRHCVFRMHVHLVFVAKYRRRMFDGDAINRLRTIFGKVCADFEAQLIEMDGEDDHVHLLVEYPPKVAVSRLVNSLKGGVEPPAAQGAARHPETLLERRTVVAVLLRLILRRRSDLHRAPVHRTAAGPTLEPRDGYAVRASLARPERRGLSRTGSATDRSCARRACRGIWPACRTPDSQSTLRCSQAFSIRSCQSGRFFMQVYFHVVALCAAMHEQDSLHCSSAGTGRRRCCPKRGRFARFVS